MSPSVRRVSASAVRRLSLYLRALEAFQREGTETVSSYDLARRSGTTGPQVRKDLSHFGSFGKRGLGYGVPELHRQVREILGLTARWKVALIGAGRIGSALFEYPHFRRRGFQIVAVLDNDPRKIGQRWKGVVIRSVRDLVPAVRESEAEMAILAVPASAAQEVAKAAVDAGIRGLLNFTPVRIDVPAGVAVNDVNLVVELESLSFALRSGAGTASEALRSRAP